MVGLEIENFPNISVEEMRGIKSVEFGIGEKGKKWLRKKGDSEFYCDGCWSG